MVDTVQPHGLFSFETRLGVVATNEDELRDGTTQPNQGHDTDERLLWLRGAGCRESNPRLRRREKNVLDIPFYRSLASSLPTKMLRDGITQSTTAHERLLWPEGLDVANQTRGSGEGRKMFLTSPFIDQAIARFEQRFHRNSDVAIVVRLCSSAEPEDRQVNVAVYEQVEVQFGFLASRFSAERHPCSSHNYLTQISP